MEKKNLVIDGLQIHFIHQGKGTPLLILHGWGGSSFSWEKVISFLAKNLSVFCFDFPGFGKSSPPSRVFSLDDFVDLVDKFVQTVGLDKFYLLGHSFGGRVAIKYAVRFPSKIKSLILVSPAGLEKKKSFFTKNLIFFAKFGKKIFSFGFLREVREKLQNIFYFIFASKDYFRAKGIMREIMKKVISEDLSPLLAKIEKETLIVWGRNDKILPVSLAQEFRSKIPKSKLLILEKVGHSPHLEVPEILSKILLEFIHDS